VRELVWRLEGRQADQWRHTAALIGAVGNLFADRANRADIRKLIPEHLRTAREPEREPPPELVKAHWRGMKAAFKKGAIKQGR
jgi:hypothetical protein